MSRDELAPVPAKPSATIVMLRKSSSCPELLLVRRRAGDAFGDSYAFPGGVVDDDEPAAHAFSRGITADEANTLLNISQGALDYYTAAIRELFEETGILLVRDSAGDWVCGSPELRALRRNVDQGVLSWSDFLRQQGLNMASDALHYFAHWETPLNLPKRWSTRFFLAELPSGQVATHDGSEVTDSRWIPAAEALSLGRDGGMTLPYPTVKTLESLAKFTTLGEMLDWAKDRASHGIEKILPERVMSDGRSKYVIPGDSDI